MHLNTSRSGLACAQFDSIERASKGSAERVLAAFNLGVAAATAGELSRAEAAFTRALSILSTGEASRDIAKVFLAEPSTSHPVGRAGMWECLIGTIANACSVL